MKKKVFIYVGHSDWGKSFALRVITDNTYQKKCVYIGGKLFRVKKMSNDDNGEKLLAFVETIESAGYENYIIAFCPNQEDDKNAREILDVLNLHCTMYFFVQKYRYNDNKEITCKEIESLRSYSSHVKILDEKLTDTLRAEKFKEYILKNT